MLVLQRASSLDFAKSRNLVEKYFLLSRITVFCFLVSLLLKALNSKLNTIGLTLTLTF